MFRKSALAAIVAALLVVCLFSVGCMAKETVVLWSFAANNIAEWEAREADIEARFNIDLVIEQIAQNAFVETLQAAMMDGTDCPDIIEWMIEENRILNADPKKCVVIPLDKYVEKSEVFQNVVPGRVAWVTYGGHVYGLPHDVHPCVLVYNDDLWKSVGVDMEKIETWDEFFQAAVKLAEEKQDGKPVHYALPHIASGLNGTMFMIQQQAGAQVLDEDGMPILENPEFKQFVSKWLEWVNLGVMCDWDWGNFGSLFANGTMAAYASPDWYLAQANDAAQNFTIRVRPLPVYESGGPRTASWGGSFMAITKLAKNPDLLYQVIEYMQYDESAIKVRFEETDMLPPFAGVWDSEVFQQPDERFGGQKVGQLLAEMAKEMPSINSGDLFWDVVIHDFSTQYTEIVAGRITLDEGLKRAQEAAERRLR